MSSNKVVNIEKQYLDVVFGQLKYVFYSPQKKTINLTDALLESTFETEFNKSPSERLYILNVSNPYNFTPVISETPYQTGDTELTVKTIDGKHEYDISYANLSPRAANNFKLFNGKEGYIAFITENEYILSGGKDMQVEFVPAKIYVDEPVKTEAGPAPVWQTKCRLMLMNRQGNYSTAVNPYMQETNSWRPSELQGIKDVVFTLISATSTELVIDINTYINNTEVNSLVLGDFTQKQSIASGDSTITITSVSNVLNRYTFVGTFANGNTIGLKNQPLMITKGFELQTPIVLTIS
jgi:hypothetical protein